MQLTNQERATFICYNEADKTATVFSYNRRMLRDLDNLAAERPEECQHVGGNGIGGHARCSNQNPAAQTRDSK